MTYEGSNGVSVFLFTNGEFGIKMSASGSIQYSTRVELNELRSLIDQALNTSAEEIEDECR